MILFYFLALQSIYLLPAEDEDLTVMEDEPTSVSSLKERGYFLDALRLAGSGELSGICGNRLVIGIFSGYAIAVLSTTIQTCDCELQAICGHNGSRSMCLSVARRRKSNAC